MSNEITNRKQLLESIPEPTVKKVHIESNNTDLYMKQLSATDQDSYESELVKLKNNKDGSVATEHDLNAMRAKYLVRCLCDAEGNRLLKDNEFSVIGSKSGHVIREMHEKALEVNEATTQQQEETEKK